MKSSVSGAITEKLLCASAFIHTTLLHPGTLMSLIGYQLAKMHSVDVIHGDLTTSNMMMRSARPREATRLSQKTGTRVDSLVASLDSMRLSDGTEKELVRSTTPTNIITCSTLTHLLYTATHRLWPLTNLALIRRQSSGSVRPRTSLQLDTSALRTPLQTGNRIVWRECQSIVETGYMA